MATIRKFVVLCAALCCVSGGAWGMEKYSPEWHFTQMKEGKFQRGWRDHVRYVDSETKQTLLHAVVIGSPDNRTYRIESVIKEFENEKLDVNAKDSFGKTPFDHAVELSKIKFTALLRKYQPRLEQPWPERLQEPPKFESTDLHGQLDKHDDLELLKYLLFTMLTPREHATRGIGFEFSQAQKKLWDKHSEGAGRAIGDLGKIKEILTEYENRFNKHFPDESFSIDLIRDASATLLMKASENGYPHVVGFLLEEKNADPNARDSSGDTSLTWAAMHSKHETEKERDEYKHVFSLLIEGGANPNLWGMLKKNAFGLVREYVPITFQEEILGILNQYEQYVKPERPIEASLPVPVVEEEKKSWFRRWLEGMFQLD